MNTQLSSTVCPYGKILIFIGLAILFSGCATMNKKECLTADWYQIGFEDGTKGYPVSHISHHRKACSTYDIIPDLQVYLNGRDKGLKSYCTPYNGYRLGASGQSYQDQCQMDSAPVFLQAYNRGKDVYHFKRNLKNENSMVKRLKHKLGTLEKELSTKERVLSKKCSNQQDCKRALDEIRLLDNERMALAYDILQKETHVQSMRQTLADMENQNTDY